MVIVKMVSNNTNNSKNSRDKLKIGWISVNKMITMIMIKIIK